MQFYMTRGRALRFTQSQELLFRIFQSEDYLLFITSIRLLRARCDPSHWEDRVRFAKFLKFGKS